MTPQISLIIPGIRPQMFQGVYDSFCKCWHGTFEIVWVTPLRPGKLKTTPRGSIQWIEDYGCPSRALQIGWLNAKADLVSFGTDDATYFPDVMNKSMRTLWENNFDYKMVITCPYTESDHWSKWMLTPCYYHAYFHSELRLPNIPFWAKLYMYGLISKKVLEETGGFNCKYESMAYAYVDLSLRLQYHGCHFIVGKDRICHCVWQNKEQSDHSPVHKACTQHDSPLLRGVYTAKKFVPEIIIPSDNWKYAPSKWPRRFHD